MPIRFLYKYNNSNASKELVRFLYKYNNSNASFKRVC